MKTDSPARAHILILTTGGTIAGGASGNTNVAYQSGLVSGEQLVASLPRLATGASLTVKRVADVGSQDMSFDIWEELLAACQEAQLEESIDGVVITHGTDTMEETASFLYWTLKLSKPLVLTGAMRPADGVDPDGPVNLRDAITIACDRDAVIPGPLVVMAGKCFSGIDICKSHTQELAAFSPRWGEVAGELRNHKLRLNPPVVTDMQGRFHGLDLSRGSLPVVDVLPVYVGAPLPSLEEMGRRNVQGVVVAGVGNGNMPAGFLALLAEARQKGIFVVRASRVPFGKVSSGSEVDDRAYGYIPSYGLSPVQARILLMLLIAKGAGYREMVATFSVFE